MPATSPCLSPRASASRAFAFVLLAAVVLVASCGGGHTVSPVVARVGDGTVPLYQSSTEQLTLPQLKVADTILTGVKLQLKKDGSWALLSAGVTRVAAAADRPDAVLEGQAGSTDLNKAQVDATLTVARLHVGTQVFGPVAIRLTGQRWAFATAPQELKALNMADFKSNANIRADESHHVVLKSQPDIAVQDIPMQLAARNYKFCMDAQAEGADSMTLFNAAGNTVFTLKAGEPCVTITASEGPYTLQHRYGGTGTARTVFMRHQANTTTAALAAQRAPAPTARQLMLAATPQASRQAAVSQFSGTEYWSVRRAALSPVDPNFYVYLGITPKTSQNLSAFGPIFCSDPMAFAYATQWQNNTFVGVDKDTFGAPMHLTQPIACTNAQLAQLNVSHVYISVIDDPRIQVFPIDTTAGYPSHYNGVGYSSPDGSPFPWYTGSALSEYDPIFSAATLAVINQNWNQFALSVTQTRPPFWWMMQASNSSPYVETLLRAAVTTFGPVVSLVSGVLVVGNPSDTATPFAVAFRYFPDGLPASRSLGVGQVALFTGANCSGTAVISEGISMPMFNADTMPTLKNLGTSFQLGLQTTATTYSLPNYMGESKQFDQLPCITPAGGPPGSMAVAVDTVTMIISTDACEYCNLTGLDFTGVSLANVKLSHANLSNLVLSNLDLSGADLRYATLQGAKLNNANLEGANLCSAQLNGSVLGGAAASLAGAHLKNANLALTNLDGVVFSGASFYGSQQSSCQQTSCDSYVAPACASAYKALINNTKFDSAYLANVDMANATGVAVDFSGAVLFGVSFSGASLGLSTSANTRTSFRNAGLQGVDFSHADLTYVDFKGAAMDFVSDCGQAKLSTAYAQFPGAKLLASTGSPTTCAVGRPAAQFCVQSIFAASPAYPTTNCTNTCADGSTPGQVDPRLPGACLGTATTSCSWPPTAASANPDVPVGVCQAAAPLCGDAFRSTANKCW